MIPGCLGRPTMEGNTARGASSPAKPALHMPDPLSTTKACTSSSAMIKREFCCGGFAGKQSVRMGGARRAGVVTNKSYAGIIHIPGIGDDTFGLFFSRYDGEISPCAQGAVCGHVALLSSVGEARAPWFNHLLLRVSCYERLVVGAVSFGWESGDDVSADGLAVLRGCYCFESWRWFPKEFNATTGRRSYQDRGAFRGTQGA